MNYIGTKLKIMCKIYMLKTTNINERYKGVYIYGEVYHVHWLEDSISSKDNPAPY